MEISAKTKRKKKEDFMELLKILSIHVPPSEMAKFIDGEFNFLLPEALSLYKNGQIHDLVNFVRSFIREFDFPLEKEVPRTLYKFSYPVLVTHSRERIFGIQQGNWL